MREKRGAKMTLCGKCQAKLFHGQQIRLRVEMRNKKSKIKNKQTILNANHCEMLPVEFCTTSIPISSRTHLMRQDVCKQIRGNVCCAYSLLILANLQVNVRRSKMLQDIYSFRYKLMRRK